MNEISEVTLKEMSGYCMTIANPPVFIHSGDHITREVIDFLRDLKKKTNAEIVASCIQSSPEDAAHTKEYCFFTVDQKCKECGKVRQVRMSKTNFRTEFACGKEPEYGCEECREKKEIERRAERAIECEKAKKDFIRTYCEPNKAYVIEGKPSNVYYRMRSLFCLYAEEASRHLKRLDYDEEFLQTPYWKIVASYSKYKAKYRCSMCNSTEKLNVHHRYYGTHGEEIYHPEDLFVLCNDCHYRFHFGKADNSAPKEQQDA